MTEKLKCKAGHEWARKPSRGRKPEWCPKHKPHVRKPVERLRKAPEPIVEEVKPEPAPLRINLSKAIVDRVEEALTNQNVDGEIKYKLRYIQKTLHKPGNRAQADINMLVDTRTRILEKI